MRTVHEPEPPRASATNGNSTDSATGQPKKGPKIRLVSAKAKAEAAQAAETKDERDDEDDDDDEEDDAVANDNIKYIPAHHPVTGQPGFMITYPDDIIFTQWESEIPADSLMRLLRRQIAWAHRDAEQIKAECEQLEDLHQDEWTRKELLLDALMERQLAAGLKEDTVEATLASTMQKDLANAEDVRGVAWTGEKPVWAGSLRPRRSEAEQEGAKEQASERRDDMMAVGALMGLSAG